MDGCLQPTTRHLYSIHMQAAIGELHASRAFAESSEPFARCRAHQSALSSIIHACAGLESALSLLRYQMFTDTESRLYVPPEQRNLLIRRLIDSWERSVRPWEKVSFILESQGQPVDRRLEAQLAELNNLRNGLVHGSVYNTTYLMEHVGEGCYEVADQEDSVDWKRRFPNTQFAPIHALSHRDAYRANQIVLNSVKALARATRQVFSFVYQCETGVGSYNENGTADIRDALEARNLRTFR